MAIKSPWGYVYPGADLRRKTKQFIFFAYFYNIIPHCGKSRHSKKKNTG
jgi:hypothetical protein